MNKQQWETGVPEKGITAKCPLFSVEIIFWVNFDREGRVINNYDRWHIPNQSFRELDALREKVISYGFFLQRAPGRGEIIFPHDIKKMLVDLQSGGFKDPL